jgi:hypothetical protein
MLQLISHMKPCHDEKKERIAGDNSDTTRVLEWHDFDGSHQWLRRPEYFSQSFTHLSPKSISPAN